MNIYVSNLSWGTSSESLQNLFAQFGEVSSANVITDRETGRSRGFGFVEMSDDGEGQKAIDRINGSEFEGKVLTVNVARPKTERSSGGYGGGNRGGNGGYGGGYNRRRYYSGDAGGPHRRASVCRKPLRRFPIVRSRQSNDCRDFL